MIRINNKFPVAKSVKAFGKEYVFETGVSDYEIDIRLARIVERNTDGLVEIVEVLEDHCDSYEEMALAYEKEVADKLAAERSESSGDELIDKLASEDIEKLEAIANVPPEENDDANDTKDEGLIESDELDEELDVSDDIEDDDLWLDESEHSVSDGTSEAWDMSNGKEVYGYSSYASENRYSDIPGSVPAPEVKETPVVKNVAKRKRRVPWKKAK